MGPELEEPAAMLWIWVQGYLRDIVGSVPDHCNQVRIAVKQVIILLLVEDLAYNLYKMQRLRSAVERRAPGLTKSSSCEASWERPRQEV